MGIILRNVSQVYESEYTKEQVLENVNLTLEKGKIYCMIGPSGSGKSTLLNIMGGLLQPTNGSVIIDTKDITKFNSEQLAELRVNKIGYIFQVRIAKKDVTSYKENYENIMKKLEIKDKENAYIHQLSGGQQQRVAIARCLIMQPDIILADEPTGNLDSENTEKFISLVQTIMKDLNTTFVIVTHDERLCDYCDHTIRVRNHNIEFVA